jgi:hypothetical protein
VISIRGESLFIVAVGIDRNAGEPPLHSSEDASLIDHAFAAFAIALEFSLLLNAPDYLRDLI